MRRLPRFLVLSACAMAAAAGWPARPLAQAPAARVADVRPAAADDEVRGLWVLRTSLTSPESIAAMVRMAQSGGFNTLLVQVRGRGEAYYQSHMEPRASELDARPADFDPLATAIDLAHQARLRVHAWVSVNLVANATTLPRSRDHVVSRHPEWLMLPRPLARELRDTDVRSPGYIGRLVRWTRAAPDQVEGLYLSPITAGARDYTAAVVGDLVASYPLDGIHFDYVRYPNETLDYSPSALAEFRSDRIRAVPAAERQKLDRLAAEDPTIWASTFPDAWTSFRRDRLTQLLGRLRGVAKAARPQIAVSAAVSPNSDEARNHGFQDWGLWIGAGLLDVVCPMTYTTDLNEFTTLVTRARVLAGSSPVWAGIGAYRLPVARALDHVRAARQIGATGVVLFSYDSLTTPDGRSAVYFSELRRLFLGPASGDGSIR